MTPGLDAGTAIFFITEKERRAMTTETTNHRAVLGDLYDDLQLYREADFDLEHTVRAVRIAGRRTCAIQQLADPTSAQEGATENLVRALWAWQKAQVEPTPEAEVPLTHYCRACGAAGGSQLRFRKLA